MSTAEGIPTGEFSYDVFISHATGDETTANKVCAILEQQGTRCFIAPRDIRPGLDWREAIVEAIGRTRAMVLVFSDQANRSAQIRRELQIAFGREIPVIPFRIENVTPRGSLEYSLSGLHWLGAVTPPIEAHIKRLGETVRMLGPVAGPHEQL